MNLLKRVFSKITSEQKTQTTTSEHKQQIASSVGTSIIEGIKIAMATLLSVFVPQYCEDTQTTCTLQQNFENLSSFNSFVIAWNLITLALFIKLTFVQNKREAYFITHLDESKTHPYNSFEENMYPYPTIKSRVHQYNKQLRVWTNVTSVAFCINICVSAVLVFHFFYDGFRTITTLVANVLLVSSKLYQLRQISKECLQARMMALSTVATNAVSFNVIDPEYAIDTGQRNMYAMTIKIDGQSLKRLRSSSRRQSV
jgi:hypothetical protein